MTALMTSSSNVTGITQSQLPELGSIECPIFRFHSVRIPPRTEVTDINTIIVRKFCRIVNES